MKFLLIPLLSLLLFSCSIDRKIYSSNIINTPLLDKKGSFSASATGSVPAGFDVNGGYALTDHIALIAGANAYSNADREEDNFILSSSRDSSTLHYRQKSVYLGIGYYLPVSKDDRNNFFGFYTGYISGLFKMNEDIYTIDYSGSGPATVSSDHYHYRSNLNRWFLQSGYYFNNENFSFASTMRFSYIGYTNVKTDYPSSIKQSSRLPPDAYPAWSPFLDLAINPKFFFPKNSWFGVELYTSFTFNLRQPSFRYYGVRAGTGICIRPSWNNK